MVAVSKDLNMVEPPDDCSVIRVMLPCNGWMTGRICDQIVIAISDPMGYTH